MPQELLFDETADESKVATKRENNGGICDRHDEIYESAEDSDGLDAVDTDCHDPVEGLFVDNNVRRPDGNFVFVSPATEWSYGYYPMHPTA
jgi:hypothetical protein